MIKAIISDMDGLLVDTEPLHFRSWLEIFTKYGVPLTESTYVDHWVRLGKGAEDFLRQRESNLDVTQLRAEKREKYHALIREQLQVFDHVVPFLELVQGAYPLALATASYRPDADAILRKTQWKFFQTVVSANDVLRTKPDPEAFLLAGKRLGVSPEHCLVLEDAQKGIEAAHAAGMKSIAVPTVYTRDNDFSKATLVVNDLGEVTLDLIASL